MALTQEQSKRIDDMITEEEALQLRMAKIRQQRSTEGRVISIEVDAEYVDEFGIKTNKVLSVGGLSRCQVNEIVNRFQAGGFVVSEVRVYDQEDAQLVETMTDYD